ncbi:MAG: MobA/MobL family protein [Hydrococcus sp. RM1_1_31]|nr:MobA/MobL family protein [Hydrococcus sp. RM1_1_31]
MAIYHLNASVISRSAGRSVTAAAAYRAAEKIYDERTGQTFDYTRKSGVDATIILAPAHVPDWVNSRALLWNEVEKVEKRKDSQLAREIDLAIPVELNNFQKQKLVSEFVNEQFVELGMVADVAFHH